MDEASIDLSGQVAIVTGGGRGIGRAIAQTLAAAGAAVAIAARSADEIEETAALIRAAGGRCLPVRADVTDRAAVETLVRRTQAALGPIDLLVNNAGSHAAVGDLWEVDPELWWADVESNLRGPFLCSRAVLPGMIARGRGRIVNLASGAALEPRPQSTAYASAKAAVLRLTDSLAAAVTEHGIGVFAVHPGGVRTALAERIMASDAGRAAYPQWRALEWAPPERVARLIAVLASGRADALSGRYIDAAEDVAHLIRRASEIVRDDLYTLRLRRLT